MKNEKVLIVEDDEPLLKFLNANLKARGYEVIVAQDGLEALDQVEREMPDLIILDINLPKIDGLEVCRRVRQWCKTPIMIVSARGRESDKVTCLDMGADDYITKPFSSRELVARIKAVMHRTTFREESPEPVFSSDNLTIDFARLCVTLRSRG